ncbi:MAG TPA: tetratricopeptide repeat protein [Gemmatimonadales bacterium]
MANPTLPLCFAVLLAGPLLAQSPEGHIARGDSLNDLFMPGDALEEYKSAILLEPRDYGALWRAARSQVDVAKLLLGDTDVIKRARDSAYAIARDFAVRAVEFAPNEADGHFTLALALGQLSRTRGGKERVRFGREIYDEAARSLELDPDHDGAHHILGAWHAEVKRLSGLTRFLAKTFMGGGFMDRANWDSSVVHLERAVELRPSYIHHRLELAEVYIDLKRFDEARAQLELIPGLRQSDVLDDRHRERAAQLRTEITAR